MEENNNPSAEPNYTPQPGIQSASVENKPPMSNESRTIITVLLLVFVYPIGLIFMWMWMKWPTWVKVVLTALVFVPFILGILLAITLIAINPARQFSQANNTKRTSDVNAILNSVSQFAAENNGTLPGNIPRAYFKTHLRQIMIQAS